MVSRLSDTLLVREYVEKFLLEFTNEVDVSKVNQKNFVSMVLAGTSWTAIALGKASGNEIDFALVNKKAEDKRLTMKMMFFADESHKVFPMYCLIPTNTDTHDNIRKFRSLNQYGFTEDKQSLMYLTLDQANKGLKKYEKI